MEWTKEAPTEPGWYWWREYAKDDEPFPREVYKDIAGLLRVEDVRCVYDQLVTEEGGEWAGPIQPPDLLSAGNRIP